MSPKQSTLVLLTVAVAVMVISAQVTVTLNEMQRRVEVPFGSSLTLCCDLKMKNQGRSWVSWSFNRSGSSFNNDTLKIFTEVFNKSTKTPAESNRTKQNLRDDAEEETLPKYSLLNVTHKDSGWYFCEVTIEIPFLQVNKSQGAEVVIMKTVTEHTTYQSQDYRLGSLGTPRINYFPVSPTNAPLLDTWWMWIVLGVSSLVLIVLLIICVLRTRRLRRRRDSECPVYANMRPTHSPRTGKPAGNLETVSSSQHLRTPSPGRRYEEDKRKHKQ